MNDSRDDIPSVDIDLEADVPTVRFDPKAYRTKLEQQVFDEFYVDPDWEPPTKPSSAPAPITQRAVPSYARKH